MKRFNASVVRATLFGAAVLSLSVWTGVASASTINVAWTIRGAYTCIQQCAETNGKGTAHSDSKVLGQMTWINQSGPGSGVAACAGGFSVAEIWEFTAQNGKDKLDVVVTDDDLCPTADPNVFTETGTFTIAGGTGRFSNATGGGNFQITDLGHPSTETGTFNANITGVA
jgi:hypothetical protein